MGIFKDAKVSTLAAEATKAAEAGRSVFAPKLNTPATQHSLSGEIVDWSMMVAAVESAGWRLEHWSVAMDAKGRPEAYPLFRRV
jgi:hypothetical protein